MNRSTSWRRSGRVLCNVLLCTGLSATLPAQTVSLALGDSARLSASPGTRLAVPVRIDLSLSAGVSLASLQGKLRWPTSRLQLDSLRAPADWTVVTNSDSAAAGVVTVSTYSTAALAATAPVALAYFTTTTNAGGARVAFVPSAAGGEDGRSVLAFVQPRSLDVCIGSAGRWGDVTDDGTVNVIDAQQIARHSVGLSVGNLTVLLQRGDVTSDNSINVIDAQQVARFSVGLAANTRINTSVLAIPTPVSVGMLAPSTTEVAIGSGIQLTAEPRDASGASLAGCPVIAWSSSAPSVATVSASGLVTGVSPGTVTITASSGGQTAAVTLTVRAVVTNGTPVALGASHSCALSAEGQAHCWGNNLFGQLGDGTTESRYTPVPVSGSTRFVMLETASDQFTTCGLDAGGLAWCWGRNNGGQLGDGTTTDRAVPTRVQTARRFLQLTLGEQHACAVATDGETYCWGSNAQGQLGDGGTTNTLTPVRVMAPVRFVRVEAGPRHTCGIPSTGDARCWGLNDNGQLGNGTTSGTAANPLPVPVSTTSRFAALSAGTSHTCGVTTSGTVLCWGANSQGELGIGSATSQNTPTAVVGGPFTEVQAGGSHTCARATAGILSCWGRNWSGQVGDGTNTMRFSPVAVSGGSSFLAVVLGGSHSCGIVTVGSVLCWGDNQDGQLGNGTQSSLTAPAAIAGGLTFQRIRAGSTSTCGLSNTGAAYCWGSNLNGRLGIGIDSATTRAVPTAVIGGRTYTDITAHSLGSHQCALTATGSAWCWGRNVWGQLGDGTTADRHTPTAVVDAPAFTSLSAGRDHSCGITGAGAVSCWGGNQYGQLGNGTTTASSRTVPAQHTIVFSSVVTGFGHSCALTQTGAAWCWGLNNSGQLGDGTQTNRLIPTPIAGNLAFSTLVAGSIHTCGITLAGELYCWGSNTNGQIGDGSGTNRLTPTLVATGPFTSVTNGGWHTCARASSGSVSCWGYNFRGQLGDGSLVQRSLPTPVVGGIALTILSGGQTHTCGLTATGVGYCWGMAGVTGVDLPAPLPRPVVSSVVFRGP